MKRIFKNESGKSVLEVLAVLSMIAVVTISGLTGYAYFVKHQNRQQAVKDVSSLVLNLKASGVKRRYDAGETIAVKEVVKGPEMAESGYVLKLPDSETSYAVVTSLGGNAFAMSIQAEPQTIENVLTALDSESISFFEPVEGEERLSAQELVKSNETFVNGNYDGWKKGTKEAEEVKLKYTELGRARVVFDCPEGSSSYSYIYGIECNMCPQSMKTDANGNCCYELGCGNLCACPSGTTCDKQKQQCVICAVNDGNQQAGNEQCWVRYNNDFAQHVCNGATNKCIECLTDADCSNPVGPQNPNPNAQTCLDKRCVECTTSYGTGVGVECPTTDKPLCQMGKCEPCPSNTTYDPATGRCVCPSPLILNVTTGECVFCYDSSKGVLQDAGCNTAAPICHEAGTTSVTIGGVSQEAKGQCINCMTDDDCPTGEPNFYCENNMCVQCDTTTPFFNRNDRTCYACQDNRMGGTSDKGCVVGTEGEDNQLCKPITANGNGTQGFGNSCYVCYNNNYDAKEGEKDDGCSSDKPLCEAAKDEYGTVCHHCVNDKADAQKDSGCSDEKPLCEAASNAFGTTCGVCINDKKGIEVDMGCSAEKPMCNGTEDGGMGDACSNCPEGQVFNETTKECVPCYDSVSGTQSDAGCVDPNKPICVTAGYKNDGTKTSGTTCYQCLENADCPSEKPICNENNHMCEPCPTTTPLWFNGVCAFCYDDVKANGQDAGCGVGANAGKPVCFKANSKDTSFISGGTNKIGDVCVECLNDGHCPTDKPFCRNYTCENECPANTCRTPDGQCIQTDTYIDLKRASGSDLCECYDKLESTCVNDMGNSCKLSDWDTSKKRRTSTRQRYYNVPKEKANFYCEYNFYAMGEADDFVVAKLSDGIGANSAHDSWKEAHDNSIAPRRANTTVKGNAQQKKLVVQDRWLREVGYSGTFEFRLKSAPKGMPHSGTKKNISVGIGWNNGKPDSKGCFNIDKWREKK